MLKWLCENCMTYRPSSQAECHCGHDSDSMFGDDWDAEEPQVGEVIRKRPTPRQSLAWAPLPQHA
jgi:hypothetical protein